jgi:hypothetical protein
VGGSPTFFESLRYEWKGAHTIGWYSDFGPYYSDGRPYFRYSYRVGAVTFGGQGLYDDDTSDIYFRHVGEPIGVQYLTQRPWVSTIKPTAWNFRFSRNLLALSFVMFSSGLWLSLSRVAKPKEAFDEYTA